MVRWAAAEEAAAYARDRQELSVGLHLDLGEWDYAAGEWRARYQVVDAGDRSAVEAEVRRQLHSFRRLLGRNPTHLDSHQHVHRQEPVRSALGQVGRELGVPVRDVLGGVVYRGDFYGQDGKGRPLPEAITVDALLGLLRDLPRGLTELGCHPGEPDGLKTTYCHERAVEVQTLCDARVRSAVSELGIRLCSFASATAVTVDQGSPPKPS